MRSGKAGECFSAQHGAVVVDEIQDQWLLAEVVAEFNGASDIVDEGEIRGNLRIEMLFDADVFEVRRTDAGRGRHDALGHGLGHGLPGGECQDMREASAADGHRVWGRCRRDLSSCAPTGQPRAAVPTKTDSNFEL